MPNTIDVLGDNITAGKLIDKSISDFEDNKITSIGNNAFHSCSQLTKVSFPVATSIGTYVFSSCSQLTTVILGNTSQVVTLSNTNAFTVADNAIIYVPDALVEDYKAATNWSSLASRIKGISELPST